MVIFRDFEGREIRVVTDLMGVTAEQIALIYKARWQIEVFFRWIKQHLNIPTLFGTTENAVYGQLFSALIVFVLLKWLFDVAKQKFPRHADLTFVRFTRLLLLDKLPVEWTHSHTSSDSIRFQPDFNYIFWLINRPGLIEVLSILPSKNIYKVVMLNVGLIKQQRQFDLGYVKGRVTA